MQSRYRETFVRLLEKMPLLWQMDEDKEHHLGDDSMLEGIRFKCVVCGEWYFLPNATLRTIEVQGGVLLPYCNKCKPPEVGFKLLSDTVVEKFTMPGDIPKVAPGNMMTN